MSATPAPLLSAEELRSSLSSYRVFDCRFSLADASAGEQAYDNGHIPGALYAHLERDLSAPLAEHGGRHPLPAAGLFCSWLASKGIGTDTAVVAYDDSGLAFAARFWWMLRALGYSQVQVLDGGLSAWTGAGGELVTDVIDVEPVAAPEVDDYRGRLDIDGLRNAMEAGINLVDSREEKRYLGVEEPIDPVAGHIPGAVNHPWQEVTDERGLALEKDLQAQRWSGLEQDKDTVVYCGSGVTACVNLLSMAVAGREDAKLYAGSWSDWCSRMD